MGLKDGYSIIGLKDSPKPETLKEQAVYTFGV